MFKEVKLKLRSTYKYVQLTKENLATMYDQGLIMTTNSKEVFLNKVQQAARPITLRCCSGISCFLNNHLVLQYDSGGVVTGAIAFNNKEEMLEYFEETE